MSTAVGPTRTAKEGARQGTNSIINIIIHGRVAPLPIIAGTTATVTLKQRTLLPSIPSNTSDASVPCSLLPRCSISPARCHSLCVVPSSCCYHCPSTDHRSSRQPLYNDCRTPQLTHAPRAGLVWTARFGAPCRPRLLG